MKYLNHLNILLAIVGFAVVAYAASTTFFQGREHSLVSVDTILENAAVVAPSADNPATNPERSPLQNSPRPAQPAPAVEARTGLVGPTMGQPSSSLRRSSPATKQTAQPGQAGGMPVWLGDTPPSELSGLVGSSPSPSSEGGGQNAIRVESPSRRPSTQESPQNLLPVPRTYPNQPRPTTGSSSRSLTRTPPTGSGAQFQGQPSTGGFPPGSSGGVKRAPAQGATPPPVRSSMPGY